MKLHSFDDGGVCCYANFRAPNGDPCYLGVAQTSVIVKKSKLGLFGAELYKQTSISRRAATGRALEIIFPANLTPVGMKTPELKAFSNAILHCDSLAGVVQALAGCIKAAQSIDEEFAGWCEEQDFL